MRTASMGLREAIRDGKQPHIRALVKWGDGQEEWLEDGDFMAESIVFQNATTASGNFTVGGAIISAFNFSLNNWDGKFDDKDFTKATISVQVGMNVASLDFSFVTEDGKHELITEDEIDAFVTEDQRDAFGAIEWLDYGTYYFVNHRSVGSVINCETLDALVMLDKQMLSAVDIPYPTTAGMLVESIASVKSGIVLASGEFPHYNDVEIPAMPENDITQRQALAYIAQMCGCYAVINSRGLLELKWYGEPDYVVRNRFDHNLEVEDVTITGVRVVYGNEEGQVFQKGEDGYVIGIRDNPWITPSNYKQIANNIYESVYGLTFRPGSMNILSDITIEVGDVLRTSDDRGNLCIFPVTNLEYRMSLRETVACDAQPVERTDLRSLESNIFAERLAKTVINNQLTAYDTQVMELNRLMSMSMGMFETKEVADDGSYVLYLHDKPNLSESKTVWKKTIDGFGVTTNYKGASTIWDVGITPDGNAVVNVLSAIGINAGWVRTGILKSNKGGTTFNLDSGVLTLGKNKLVVESNNFTLNSSGDVKISGTITAKEGSKIGNWNVAKAAIWNAKDGLDNDPKNAKDEVIDNGVYLGTNGIALGKKNKFKVTSAGVLTATGATISGSITATSGTIGGFTIGTTNIRNGKDKLTSASNGVYIGTNGISVGKDGSIPAFKVASDGRAVFSHIRFQRSGASTTYGLWADDKGRIASGGAINFGTDNPSVDSVINSKLRTGQLFPAGMASRDPSTGDGTHWKIGIGTPALGYAWFEDNVYTENYVSCVQCIERSDARAKKDIRELPNSKALDFIMGLRPVEFRFKKNDKKSHGFIAQEVEPIADWDIVVEEQGVKHLAYNEIIADLVSVVQDLTKKVERLEGKA